MRTPKDRRRWYQFSFKLLLVLITVAALLCLLWRERTLRIEAEKQSQRNAALVRKATAELRELEVAHELTKLQLTNALIPEDVVTMREARETAGQASHEIATTEVEHQIVEAILRHMTASPKYEYEPPLFVDSHTVPAKRFLLDRPPRQGHDPLMRRGLDDLTKTQLALVTSLCQKNSSSCKWPALCASLPVIFASQKEYRSSESPEAMMVCFSRPAVAPSGDQAVIFVNSWTRYFLKGELLFVSRKDNEWRIVEEYRLSML